MELKKRYIVGALAIVAVIGLCKFGNDNEVNDAARWQKAQHLAQQQANKDAESQGKPPMYPQKGQQ